MIEHISPAMKNIEATQSFIYFNRPSELLDWSFLAIEILILIGALLTIVHAWRYKRITGSSAALFTLLNCFLYGLTMDILSYYTVENFWHGEFSVMFLFNRLPLYIALFYPAFMYHVCMMIRRYDFKPWVEAVSTGMLAGMMYMIFDNLGPILGWWVWDVNNPTTLPYLDSVPLTSYHWIFTFTIAFTFVNRFISWTWLDNGVNRLKLWISVALQPVITIFLGSILFIPYNLFAKSGPPYDLLPWAKNLEMASLVHAITFTAALWLFISQWKKPKGERDNLLLLFPFMFLVTHAFLYISKLDLFMHANAQGIASNGLAVGNLLVVVLAIFSSAVIVFMTCASWKK